MTVYLVNVLLLLAWAALLLWHRPDRVKRALFCGVASMQWIMISGLRHPSIGADTYAYRYSFYQTLATPWGQVINDVAGTYFGTLGLKDPGYAVFVKAVQLVTHEYQVFLVIVAALFMIPFGVMVYRHSSDPFISFLVYSTLFFEFFAITGTRQTIATALVVLIGYPLIVKKRFVPFLALAAVAFTIHKSALVFLPFAFLADREVSRRAALRVGLVAIVIFVLRNPIGYLLASVFFPEEQYLAVYAGAGAWTFSALLILLAIVAFSRLGLVLSAQPKARHWYNAVLVGLLCLPLTFRNPSAMRVVQYFTLFLVLLIPAVIRSFRMKDERALAYWAVIAALGFLFVQKNPQYLFFWQPA